MDSDADRLALIKGLGGARFDTDAGHFCAIFDNGFAEQSLGVPVESTQPSLTARTCDVERLSLGKGTQVHIGDDAWRIQRLEPDGIGMTRLVLQR